MKMRASEKAIELIKKYEGLRLRVYRCPSGLLTIGYGHTRTAVPGLAINKEMAEILLEEDLRECEKVINDLVKVPLTQNQYDALVSFVFNVGRGNFERSTLLKKLNEGGYVAASDEFLKWTKGRQRGGVKELPGLVRRRKEERELFLMR